MTSIEGHRDLRKAEPAGPGLAPALAGGGVSPLALYRRLGAAISRRMPKRLYVRALIIITAPLVLLQSVLTFVFMEQHWQKVTTRLSTATTRDIAALIEVYENYPQDDGYEKLINLARDKLKLNIQILPLTDFPGPRQKPFFYLLDKTLSSEIRKNIGKPFRIDTFGRSNNMEILIKLDDAIFRVTAPTSRAYASNSHIFLVWMVTTSLVLLTIAIMFLRNQIKPVQKLAEAAELFGRGLPIPPDFRPRGAQEVRQAAAAFLKMRDRIERHVEQRTTMLAGVSHDLRTILTRFKLEAAIAGDAPEMESMRADVDEMQAMLEDYMAFAKGDTGEQIAKSNLRQILEEVRRNMARVGKDIKINLQFEPIIVPLRRQAFKRAISNLVNNATRFGDHVVITVERDQNLLLILIEDDGPGIPAQEREDVFDPFHRLDHARNQNVGGTGLGLAIARDIARSHGGDITLEDSALGGLKARVRIPV